jgi:sugar fermentation stimulation protein A
MKLPATLLAGRFVRRYKRFFVDVLLDDGRELTVHCPNPGSMLGLLREGSPVVVSDSGNPERKLPFTLERIRPGRAWVGVNTMLPNHVVREAIEAGRVAELTGYARVRSEVKFGERSRIDLLLEGGTQRDCWVEVKNATLREGGDALFPDSVTERGRKHLEELATAVARGERAAMFFLVHRADCAALRPADTIDPDYAATLRRVAGEGVELLAYRAELRPRSVRVGHRVPVLL